LCNQEIPYEGTNPDPSKDNMNKIRSFLKKASAIIIPVLIPAGGFGWAHWPLEPLPDGFKADRVVVIKAAREMRLVHGGQTCRTYRIALGANPEGHKRHEGDERTPEGKYIIDWANPNSIAFISLHISYPNREDVRRANNSNLNPGGSIMVHGIRNGFGWLGRLHTLFDWTDGCIAITNTEMEEFWNCVPVGTPIEINP
jgi:murein L,D-transpeptidase YafK